MSVHRTVCVFTSAPVSSRAAADATHVPFTCLITVCVCVCVCVFVDFCMSDQPMRAAHSRRFAHADSSATKGDTLLGGCSSLA